MNEAYVDGVRLHLGSILKAIGEAMLEPLSQPALGSFQMHRGGCVTAFDLEPRGDSCCIRFKLASGMDFKDVVVQLHDANVTLKNIHVTGLAVEATLYPVFKDGKAVMFEYQDAKEGK